MREVVCVYQDCIMCGDRGKEIKLELKKYHDISIRKVSFASPEGAHLCKLALDEGIGKMPFFAKTTDGETVISRDLADFSEVGKDQIHPPKRVKKAKKTIKKTKKGADNGAV